MVANLCVLSDALKKTEMRHQDAGGPRGLSSEGQEGLRCLGRLGGAVAIWLYLGTVVLASVPEGGSSLAGSVLEEDRLVYV